MIENWNIEIFTLVNAAPDAHPWTIGLARLLAEWPIWIAGLIVAFLWVRGAAAKREALLATGLGLAVSLAGAVAIAALWHHPRPAELGIGRQLMYHSPESSFPSDHATVLFSIGLGFIATGAVRSWGYCIAALAAGTAWARLYLGIHFPFDMLGALGLALVGALAARAARPWLALVLLPPVEALYDFALRGLRLPPAIFPRAARVDSGAPRGSRR